MLNATTLGVAHPTWMLDVVWSMMVVAELRIETVSMATDALLLSVQACPGTLKDDMVVAVNDFTLTVPV